MKDGLYRLLPVARTENAGPRLAHEFGDSVCKTKTGDHVEPPRTAHTDRRTPPFSSTTARRVPRIAHEVLTRVQRSLTNINTKDCDEIFAVLIGVRTRFRGKQLAHGSTESICKFRTGFLGGCNRRILRVTELHDPFTILELLRMEI